MLLQSNSYLVSGDRRAEHDRLMRRFREALLRLGCEQFEVYEQLGPEFEPAEGLERVVQLMRFRDRRHHQAVQAAERQDRAAQDLIREFCELVDYPGQKDRGVATVHYYTGIRAAEASATAGST